MATSRTRSEAAVDLRAAHQRLKGDRSIEIDLETPEQLLDGDGYSESGIETLVGVLETALRLPKTLVVQVVLAGEGGIGESPVDAFHGHCQRQASDAWREAMTLRQGGFRELPRALLFSVTAAALGVVSGYLAQSTESTLLMVLLYAVGFMAVIAAWTIGWVPIEQALFDWRASGHTAAVYELLSTARIEVVERPRRSG